MKFATRLLLPVAFALSLVSASHASMLGAPTGRVILTVSGSIGEKNVGDVASFDRAMLKEMDWKTVESYTRWTDGATKFSGVDLATILDAVGAEGSNIVATALNDYTVEIPLSDAEAHNVLLALEIDGVAMKIRDKGPIWVIYPQTKEQAENPQFDEKMIWQLKSIKIVN
jgi:hypothetical protein